MSRIAAQSISAASPRVRGFPLMPLMMLQEERLATACTAHTGAYEASSNTETLTTSGIPRTLLSITAASKEDISESAEKTGDLRTAADAYQKLSDLYPDVSDLSKIHKRYKYKAEKLQKMIK